MAESSEGLGRKAVLTIGAVVLVLLALATYLVVTDAPPPGPVPSAPADGGASPRLAGLRAELAGLEAENRSLRDRLTYLQAVAAGSDAISLPAPPGRLAVALVGPDGQPLADSKVTVRRKSLVVDRGGGYRWEREAKTGDDGRAEIGHLEAGEYEITHRFPGGYGFRRFGVGAGRATSIEIPAPSGRTVEGEARFFEGGPVSGATVTLDPGSRLPPGQLLYHVARAGDDGRFRLVNVPPGAYRSTLTGGPLGSRPVQRDVEVPAEGPATLTLLAAVPTLHGTVRDEATGRPIVGAKVRYTGFRWTATDADGSWRLLDVYVTEARDLEISKSGYRTETRRGVRVRPGEATRIDVSLTPEPK
ncbi:MAG: carboxypeptidase regulatory-like domain-containing protein [Planctomycetota bacterium]|jgi:hypothetical protein